MPPKELLLAADEASKLHSVDLDWSWDVFFELFHDLSAGGLTIEVNRPSSETRRRGAAGSNALLGPG